MGLPGLTGVDHIGFTVPDLDQAHHFLTEVLGCEYMYTLGPYRHDDTDWMREHLNVDPRAVMQQLHFYRCGGRAIFEVFQYAAPDQRREQPRQTVRLRRPCHVAFYVDDLDAAVKYLRDQGVELLGSHGQQRPQPRPAVGDFLAPWGMQFELVSYPDGKAFDREGYRPPAQ